MEGIKFDNNKPKMSLIPSMALWIVGMVMTIGAKKYERDNWKKLERHRILDALLRHIYADMSGEFLDKETGLPHTAHVAANALMLCELDIITDNKTFNDVTNEYSDKQ